MAHFKWTGSNLSYLFLLFYLLSFSSCFMEDFALVDKKMEFHAFGVVTQASAINQKGDFNDNITITRQDILDILSADVVNKAEIISLNIHNMVGIIMSEDEQSNQTSSLDLELKFNNEDVFITKNFMVLPDDQTSATGGGIAEASPIDFSPKMGIRTADKYLNNLLNGNNDSPLILDLLVSPYNPGVSDPFTSLELDWRIGIVVKYNVCTTVPVGTQAEDCKKK